MHLHLTLSLVLSSLIANLTNTTPSPGAASSNSIEAFIPPTYEILEVDSAFVNEDACYDYLIVLKKKNEQEEDQRPLLLVMSTNNQCDLELVFRNDSALYDAHDGLYSGHDCFAGIDLERDSITIHYYGGMSTRWSETHTFLFDRETGKYILSTIHRSSDNIYDDEDADEDVEYYDQERIGLDTFCVYGVF